MRPSQHRPHPLISGTWVNSLGTLASRILGMVRDMATAALLGMSGGGVMDAFVVAFRIPNTFRRLFGEGALAASYLPVLARALEEDRRRAWQLTSTLLAWVAVLLAGITLGGEALCAAVYWLWGDQPGMSLLTGLTAVMLPYMLFICLAAQAAATLQALGHFALPALAPTLLNLCWLAGVWVVAPWLAPDKHAQAYGIAVCVLISGVLQLVSQVGFLPRFGFRFAYDWHASRRALGEVARAMLPMTAGLAITQVNTLVDSFLAWGLAATANGPQIIPWLPGSVAYPMSQGAAAAIYYGERLYEFPLALVGIAVATAIYPLLARHAARGDRDALRSDLSLGLQWVVFLGIPAGAGLVLLAEPLVGLLFQRGNFTAADTLRATRVVTCYGSGVWAFCALPVLVRGFYAVGDRATPLKIGAVMVALNLTLNLVLIWPMAEAGLATSTTVAACVQVVVLVLLAGRRGLAIDWGSVSRTAGRTLLATGAMVAVGLGVIGLLSPRSGRLILTSSAVIACLGAYLAVFAALGRQELLRLLGIVVKH